MLIYSIPVTINTLLIIPGLIIVALNGFWIMTILGLICTRFRDVGQLINSLTILLFFITPVFWPAEKITRYRHFIIFNPLYHILELIRSPLLGKSPELYSWGAGLGMASVGWLFAIWVYSRFRSRIVYWI
jgi:ABC-type polysaccharide/polyol phosphate export permease